MKITGYKLREAIKEWELRRDSATESFDGTLTKFDDEVKDEPSAVMVQIALCERAIARLQTAQAAYNLTVSLEVGDEKICLAEAIKRVGGLERIERMWRNAMRTLAPGRSSIRHRYLAAQAVTQEEPKATLTAASAREQTSQAVKRLNQVKAAIAAGNAAELDITDLNPELIP